MIDAAASSLMAAWPSEPGGAPPAGAPPASAGTGCRFPARRRTPLVLHTRQGEGKGDAAGASSQSGSGAQSGGRRMLVFKRQVPPEG